MYLHTLAEYVTGFRGRRAAYVGAEGPPSSAGPEAPAVLLAALGLDESLAVGDAVHLRPGGLAPIDGTVDYAVPGFFGVRTEDAIYRFHLRHLIGLPVAVGHHVFADVDAAREADAWRAWLESVFAAAGRPAAG